MYLQWTAGALSLTLDKQLLIATHFRSQTLADCNIFQKSLSQILLVWNDKGPLWSPFPSPVFLHFTDKIIKFSCQSRCHYFHHHLPFWCQHSTPKFPWKPIKKCTQTLINKLESRQEVTSLSKRQNNVSDTEELLSSCDISSNNRASTGAVWINSGLRRISGKARWGHSEIKAELSIFVAAYSDNHNVITQPPLPPALHPGNSIMMLTKPSSEASHHMPVPWSGKYLCSAC